MCGWRLARGLNQKQLAEKSSVSRAYICVLEGDDDANPSNAVMTSIIGALGLTMAEFYGDIPKPKKTTKLAKKARVTA